MRPFAAAALPLLLLVGCGPPSQAAARDQATARSCAWYQRCGEIASGARYATFDACEVDVRAQWNNLWPAAECEGRINAAELDLCLKAIDATSCNNALDFFNTVFNKCSRSTVCKGN